jgi:hypothetical protein
MKGDEMKGRNKLNEFWVFFYLVTNVGACSPKAGFC